MGALTTSAVTLAATRRLIVKQDVGRHGDLTQDAVKEAKRWCAGRGIEIDLRM